MLGRPNDGEAYCTKVATSVEKCRVDATGWCDALLATGWSV